jgi:predicted lipid-binding transport protein (Tim44 family)
MTAVGGRRGSRSGSAPLRPPVVAVLSPAPPAAVTPPVVVLPPVRSSWIGPVVGLAVGLLVGRLVSAALQRPAGDIGVEAVVLAAVAMIAAAAWLRFRRDATPAPRLPVVPIAAAPVPARVDTDLDRGVRDIRRTDRGFDVARFAGYAGMTFRDVQSARMARDAGGLRDRLTSAMYVELDAGCDGLRTSGRSARVAEVDVRPEVTEAWQDGNRDYVTAYVAGSMLSHTVDDATGKVVDGRPATPMPVQAFLTFTRPAGLNFWMLSIIQGEWLAPG